MSPIDQLIQQERDRISEIQGAIGEYKSAMETKQKELGDAHIRLKALLDAGRAISGPESAQDLFTDQPKRRKRALSEPWKGILQTIAIVPPLTLDEILEMANERAGKKFDRRIVRQQMKYYVKQGYLTETKEGFSTTKLGEEAIAI